MTVDAGGTRGSFDAETLVALVGHLLLVGDLANVGAVVVHPHVTDQQDASSFKCPREGTVDWEAERLPRKIARQQTNRWKLTTHSPDTWASSQSSDQRDRL